MVGREAIERLARAAGHDDLVLRPQRVPERLADRALVVDDQDRQRSRHRRLRDRLVARPGRDCGRQRDPERRAAPDLAVRRDLAAERTDDAVADREAEPGALADRLGREERLEDAARRCSGMPVPVSATSTTARPLSSVESAIRTRFESGAPSGIAWIALLSRFRKTWPSRPSSASTHGASPSSVTTVARTRRSFITRRRAASSDGLTSIGPTGALSARENRRIRSRCRGSARPHRASRAACARCARARRGRERDPPTPAISTRR